MFDRLFRSLSPNLSPHIQMFARSLCPARGCSGTPSPLVLGPLRCSHSNISCGGQAFPIGRSSAATAFGCCHSGGWPLHQFLRPPALSMDGALHSLALGCSSAWCSPVLVLWCSSAPVLGQFLSGPWPLHRLSGLTLRCCGTGFPRRSPFAFVFVYAYFRLHSLGHFGARCL